MNKLISALLFLTFSFSGCSWYISNLNIKNETNNDIVDINISNGDSLWQFDELKVGKTLIFQKRLSGEGAAILRWKQDNKIYKIALCYHTGFMPAVGTIIITERFTKISCNS